MVGVVEKRVSLSPDNHHPSPPPQTITATSTTSRRSSTISNKNASCITNIQDLGGPSGVAISIPVLIHSPSPAPSHEGKHNAASSAAPPPSSAKPASSAKPRSTKPSKPARSPSPSPPPPPPVIPLKTIRLDIRLGGPSNYEVDISQQSKDTGQRPPTPPPAAVKKVADSSDSEEEDEEKAKIKKKKVPCFFRSFYTYPD